MARVLNDTGATPIPLGRRGAATASKLLTADATAVAAAFAIACMIFYSIDPAFLSRFNLDSLSLFASTAILVGIGQLFVLSIGQFNLAIGSMGACGGVTTAALLQDFGAPLVPALLAGLAAGAAAGFIQGALVAYTPLNPFVITLALASVYLGAATGITADQEFDRLPASFDSLGSGTLLGVSGQWWLALGLAGVSWFVFRGTSLGPRLLATGGDRKAAFAAGVRVRPLTVTCHTLSGLFAAAAGVLLAAQLDSAQISIGGDWLLVSFAAPVLGGTSIAGGRVSVFGTVLGACLLTVVQNGLVIAGVSPYWVDTVYGGALVLAFAADRARRRRQFRLGAG